MTASYEAQVIQCLQRFEIAGDRQSAMDAEFLLTHSDELEDAHPDQREQIRTLTVMLWGRLLSAIDAKRDPSFNPEGKPPPPVTIAQEDIRYPDDPQAVSIVSIDTLPDPALREKYRKKLEQQGRDTAQWNLQFALYKLDMQISELAKTYFLSTFLRSPRSVERIDRCAHTAPWPWTPTRHQQLRSWVQPQE